jgi:hypothetical protein
MWLEGKATKNEIPTACFSFMKMLQQIGQFWSRILSKKQYEHTGALEHPLQTLRNWLQLIFTCSLNCNEHGSDSAFVMLLIS